MSYNRAPAPDLRRWIARLSVTQLHVPEGQTLSCGLFGDIAGLRIQLSGDWQVHTPGGILEFGPTALFCGPQTRLTPVRVRGGFVSVGLSFRPSACALLLQSPVGPFVDQVTATVTVPPGDLMALLPADGTPEQWLRALEDALRTHIATLRGAEPDPVTARFEEIAFLNPAISIAQAAREIGVDRRRLERLVNRDFGMPPKQVLKRARALDMASYLRGVADGDEAEALALRYYDESHLIHEFMELFGMSPRQFTALPQPLLTLNLEIRQARRLEAINRLEPGARRPWQ